MESATLYEQRKRKSLWAARLDEARRFWHRFRRHPLGMIGLLIITALIFSALFARPLSTHAPFEQSLVDRLQPPGKTFWLGSDELGRDIYSRIMHGTRLTLLIVAIVIVASAPLGLLLGTISGFYGGWTDKILMRITDVFLAIPKLMMALAFVAALGPGIINVAISIALTAWPPYARLARAETLMVRNSDYINAIRMAGASSFRIVFFHVVPMCLSSVIVRMSFDMSQTILIAAGLGFIGLGPQPPSPEWGAMVAAGRRFILSQYWVSTMPGIAIFVVSLGFNFMGDALRDLLDPHQKGAS